MQFDSIKKDLRHFHSQNYFQHLLLKPFLKFFPYVSNSKLLLTGPKIDTSFDLWMSLNFFMRILLRHLFEFLISFREPNSTM